MSTSPPISDPVAASTPRKRTKNGKPVAAPLLSTRVLPLDRIVPYWRNPRRIPDEAVNAVASSIREFGYQQPIVVDTNNTIVVGHTRYAALRRMQVAEVEVIVADLDPTKIKELRVLDNRAQEYTSWNYEDLVAEIGELDSDVLRSHFPEIGAITDQGPDFVDPTPVADPNAPQREMWEQVDTEAEFVCPSCFHTWQLEVTLEAVTGGLLKVPVTTDVEPAGASA